MARKKVIPKKDYYDEAWELIEESENYYICNYPGLQSTDALLKSEYEIVKEPVSEKTFLPHP